VRQTKNIEEEKG